ncbi:hypothetical protein D6745_00630 [Candidatus Woesearchaeota archaeon]|nr:MAG: hypothetical protein D6745_00630 [Candidatus Woesearchaeota archaeon]
MLASMLGFFFSAIVIWPMSKPFGFAICLIFALMFFASMISMTHAPVEAELAADFAKTRVVRRKLNSPKHKIVIVKKKRPKGREKKKEGKKRK